MRIAHFLPFAPGQCGMYETARDMIKAERLAGHEVEMVDTGLEGKRRLGAVDDRAGCLVKTRDYADVSKFDLFVLNGNIPEKFLAKTSAPLVQIMHGRPESSFRLQQTDARSPVYDIYLSRVHTPRMRLFITLWQEHAAYWSLIIPPHKLAATKHPPCDLDLYCPEGERHAWNPSGQQNILVADIWRPDGDPFHIAHGLFLAAHSDAPLSWKVHFCGCLPQLGPWQHLFQALRRAGVLGETCGMMRNIIARYRAADLVITGHGIATRAAREALACGCTLLAPESSRYAKFTYRRDDPGSIASRTEMALAALRQEPEQLKQDALATARRFDLVAFGKDITALYEHALSGEHHGRRDPTSAPVPPEQGGRTPDQPCGVGASGDGLCRRSHGPDGGRD